MEAVKYLLNNVDLTPLVATITHQDVYLHVHDFPSPRPTSARTCFPYFYTRPPVPQQINYPQMKCTNDKSGIIPNKYAGTVARRSSNIIFSPLCPLLDPFDDHHIPVFFAVDTGLDGYPLADHLNVSLVTSIQLSGW